MSMPAVVRVRPAAVALVLLCAGCATRPPAADGRAELMAADLAFAAATAERGLQGWLDAYTSDAVRLSMGGRVARGLDEIRAFDTDLFSNPELELRWMPTDAGVFRDGLHGFTTGRAAMVRAAADTVWTGTYVTLWRREAGRWKVILDTGASD